MYHTILQFHNLFDGVFVLNRKIVNIYVFFNTTLQGYYRHFVNT